MRVAFVIDGTPEGKRRPRTRVVGRIATIYSDPADKLREKLIRAAVYAAMDGAPTFTGPVRVSIVATFEPAASWSKKRTREALDGVFHTSKPDADNIAKSILDGLNPDPKAKEAWAREPFCLIDDAQAAEQFVRKRYGSPARTEVWIEALSPHAPPRVSE